MPKTITNKFRLSFCNNFIDDISDNRNTYYIAVGKHAPFSTGDDNIPTPADSIKETEVDPYGEMVLGKKVATSDLAVMTTRYNWTNNTIYDAYSNDDASLFQKKFYVAVDSGANYYVYKVLDNNNGAASSVKPTNTSESACNFITSDGYVWKLMYTMSEPEFEKFATTDFMPVVNSANVAGNNVAGAIDVIKINSRGSGYNLSFYGQFNADDVRDSIPTVTGNSVSYRLGSNSAANNDYYVGSALVITSGSGSGQIRTITDYLANSRIVTVNSAFTIPPDKTSSYVVSPSITVEGDGNNAVAWAQTASNATVNGFITTIYIMDRGSNYTYGTATVVGNTLGGTNAASLSVVIPPPGGHGTNSQQELGANLVCLSTTISNTEGGTISVENDFRSTYILRNPLFRYVTLTLTDYSGGSFIPNEDVFQVKGPTLYGQVSGNNSTNTITGSGTSFRDLSVGSSIILFDKVNSRQHFCNVVSIANSTSLVVDRRPPGNFILSTYVLAEITSRAKFYGNGLPYATLTDCEPKFTTNSYVMGITSGVYGTISGIDINTRSYNSWNTFDNRTKIGYSTVSGPIAEDVKLYQGNNVSTVNAFYHSANDTYLFATSVKGAISYAVNAELKDSSSNNYFTLSGTSLSPDIIPQTGDILYLEYFEPIERSASQSENFKIVLNF